jgi:hypothetical protein
MRAVDQIGFVFESSEYPAITESPAQHLDTRPSHLRRRGQNGSWVGGHQNIRICLMSGHRRDQTQLAGRQFVSVPASPLHVGVLIPIPIHSVYTPC